MKPILLAAAFLAVASLSMRDASAQLQLPTCSSAAKNCARIAKNPALCIQAKEACMTTGRFIGPESGRDFGPHRKQ